jgi:hypothetical protein
VPAPSLAGSAAAPLPISPSSLPLEGASAATQPAAGRRFRQTNTYSGGIVYVPEGCATAYDVILHFHGAHEYVRDLVQKAGIEAVIAVFNAGNGAERYAQAYQAGGMLDALLLQIQRATSPYCHAAAPKRVALTAWSAGYGAVEKLASRPEDRARIDAILLADGLHAGFTDRYRRTFAPGALEAFAEFGKIAISGQKLFAITHSSIATPGYGSTTECSKLLLERLSLKSSSPLVSANAGDFSIQGAGGDDKAAHIAQFRRMDETLLSKLRQRWQG